MAKHELNLEDFKPNSHKSKDEGTDKDEKRIEKVVEGKVIRKKKPLSSKFADVFLSDDVDSVKGYVIFEVLVPAIKNAIVEMITGGINMMFFGESRGRSSDGGYRDYTGYSTTFKYKGNGSSRNDYNRENGKVDLDDIVLESKKDAVKLRDSLMDLIDEYGEATIADLYYGLGITSDFPDNGWGWKNLRGCTIRRVRDGYLITLPKPILLRD